MSGEEHMVQSATPKVTEGVGVESSVHPDLFPLAVVRLEMDDEAPDRTPTVVA